jgi:hypothetical protein
MKYFLGPPPECCDSCGTKITDSFIDGQMKSTGPTNYIWAYMCKECHKEYGIGLGSGKGQQFEKDDDGKFLKVSG